MTGIFVEPKAAYLSKMKEKEQVEAEYTRITGTPICRTLKGFICTATQQDLMRQVIAAMPEEFQ